MKFSVLALDYDGTIAIDGKLDEDVRSAIAEVRSGGIVTILVTGRMLGDLRRVMGDFGLFDAVVGENGAVLAYPTGGKSATLGSPPPSTFLQELKHLGLNFSFGESVVEADAELACEILKVIRRLEVPLVMLFNRGRLMILPQAISKATGLRTVLTQLRRSAHNAIAIGDAENDHQLLEACEVAMAVGWGSQSLKSAADGVIEGESPKAVADYIRNAAKQGKLPPNIKRHQILVGSNSNASPVELAVTGRKILIAGDPQTGKSWVAGMLCEQLIQRRYSVCVIDPEGDYGTMEALPGVILLGGNDPPPRVRELSRALRNPEVSIVVGLSKMRPRDKREYVSSLLLMLAALRREVGIPHHIVIDEAHYFLGGADVAHLLDFELSSYTLITYRATGVHPHLLASLDATIVTRLTDAEEVRALQTVYGSEESESEWDALLGNLALEEAVLLRKSEASGSKLLRFYPASRLTTHVRHLNKYLDLPLPEAESFVFTSGGIPTGNRASTIKEFTAILATTPAGLINEHLQRGDFSRWIEDVFRDNVLASGIREIEASYRLGQLPDINDALIQIVQERYQEPSERK